MVISPTVSASITRCQLFHSVSGVGTVAAKATTLFRPYINIHNLHAKLLVAGSEAKVKQPPLHQSRMQLHALKYTVS